MAKRLTPTSRAPRSKKSAAAAVAPAAKSESARLLALDIARCGSDKKALDVAILDVRGLSSYAEFFVLMTAESEPQLLAIADHVEATLKEKGERPIGVEGARGGRWVLVDYGDVVAHVFHTEARGFYDLEGLWADAERLAVPE